MGYFSRNLPWEARAADTIMALLLSYPVERRAEGITVKELFWDHPERLKHVPSVIAAVYLLEEEGLVVVQKTTGHTNYLDSIRVFPPVGVDIPPLIPAHHRETHSVETYADHNDVVSIEFYRTDEGKHFVWSYVGRVEKGGDYTYKHFSLRRHFDDEETARECALNQGRVLTELGFINQF